METATTPNSSSSASVPQRPPLKRIFTWLLANLRPAESNQPKDELESIRRPGAPFPLPLTYLDYPPIVHYFCKNTLDLNIRFYDGPFQGPGEIKEMRKRLYDCILATNAMMTPEKRERIRVFHENWGKRPQEDTKGIYWLFRRIWGGSRRGKPKTSRASDAEKDQPSIIPMLFLDHPGVIRHFKESAADSYLSKFGIPAQGLDNFEDKCKAVIDAIITVKAANPDEVVYGRLVGKRPFPMPALFHQDPDIVHFFDDYDMDLYLDLYVPAHQSQGPEDLKDKRKRLYNAILAAKSARLPNSWDIQLDRYYEHGKMITVKGLRSY
ncbi:hypothetical protein ONZ45_g6971 [Pleurotus djamor]|nr:hypothetical protein ONZ45_g6971 [Pleurotus djamor]